MTAVGRVIAGAAFGIGLALLVAACIGGPDCGATQEIRSYPNAAPERIVLDAAHPVAEQDVAVHLDAAALPTDASFDARLYVLAADASEAGPTAGPSAPSTEPPHRAFAVTIVDEGTGAVVPASAPWEESIVGVGRPLASIPISCSAGGACDRTYRVRFAIPEGVGGAVPVTWTLLTRVTYEGVQAPCGMPSDARTELETKPPTRLSSDHVATAAPVGRDEGGGPVAIRHLTVNADHAPMDASLRLSIARPGFESEEDPAWRQWVRVIEDDGSTPLADALVGAAPYTGIAIQGGTLDVPILADCAQAGPCDRAYWLLFQNFAAAPRPAVWGPDTPPPSLGKMTWTASASATYAEGVDAGRLGLAIDDDRPAAVGPSTVSASAQDVNVSGAASPTAVDITFDVPDRPPGRPGPDAFATSFAVVHVQASGRSLQTRLEGDGAGPLTGYANGDGTVNLVAHPLDPCPASGACSAVVTLVAGGTLPWSGSERGSGTVDLSVDLIGAPAGSKLVVGQPYLLPTTAAPSGPPIAQLIVLVVVGLSPIALVVVLRRRRQDRIVP